MQRKTLTSLLTVALLATMVLTSPAEAQREGRRRGEDGQGRRGGFGRGGGFGFGGGAAILGLLRVEAVREEIKITEDQQELVDILSDELNEGRPEFPENYREMTEAEQQAAREEFGEKYRKWSEEQTAQAKDTLKTMLEPAQYTRLTQISIQTQGINALLDPDVVAALMISDEQKKQLEATQQANREAFGELFSGGRDGFDREAMREKMDTLRKEGETKMLAHLTADQKTAFEALKGAHFEMPERQFGFGRGRGPGGDGGRPGRPGRPGGNEDRPQRPE